MEPRFKLRFSRMFQSSFVSCRSRNLSDLIHKSVFIPSSVDGSFRKTRPDTSGPAESLSSSHRFPPPSEIPGGRTCPPASPISPSKPKKKSKKKQRKKQRPFCSFNSSTAESKFGGTWWYSSEDDETDTVFSSKSRSSDSSASRRRRKSRRKRGSEMGVFPDSFAVVKKSSDLYNDFRESMVEMIVEKQIFSGEDLEMLLQCFLSLNSHHHHNVIVEAFTQILEVLFSDWGS